MAEKQWSFVRQVYVCMYDQINLYIWKQKAGDGIIRAGAIVGTNTVHTAMRGNTPY